MARKYDASGNYHGSDLIIKKNKWGHETNEVIKRPYMEYEAMFGVDLNKDGKIASGINPNKLMDISGKQHHEVDGYGGSGVVVIEKSAMHNIKSLLDFYINRTEGKSSYVILQEYVEGAEDGDVRVLMLHGEPIGALRRRPAKGDARSNISAGGTVEKYKLTKEDKVLCKKVGEKLVRDGIYYAGLDLIGGKLIEVNVMSPGTITDINKLNNTKLQRKIADYLERVVEEISDKKNKSELIKLDPDEEIGG